MGQVNAKFKAQSSFPTGISPAVLVDYGR